MKHLAIPGGWEGDARPDGGYVVAMFGGVWLSAHLGPLSVPDAMAVRYPRLTPVGPLAIAGQTDRVVEWQPETGWRDVTTQAIAAVSPVIYDQAGTLHLIDRAVHDSASGWLYVAPDGRPVTAEQADRPGDVRYLIDLGEGWQVAQGQHGGCWIITPEGRYLAVVEDGASPFRDAMFIRAQRDGDAVAVCYYERPVPVAHLFWFTLSEARSVFQSFSQPRPPVTYAPVERIGRPLWFGFFEFAPATDLPRNCAVPVVQGASWLDVHGPGWRYVSGDPDGDLAAIDLAIRFARDSSVEVLAYVPRRAQQGLPTSADVQGIEAYIGTDETDEQFVARVATAVRCSHRAVLIAQCYTSNTTLTSDLRRVPGLISRLARDYQNVEGILVFSGSGRATGWQDHPEVHDAWRQVFAGITAVTPEPPAPEPPPVNHPEIPESSPEEPMPEPPPVLEEPPVPTLSNALYPGEVLRPDDERCDPTGRTRLVFQGDRNLVLYWEGHAIWSAQLAAYHPTDVVMQTDGNLVAYDANRAPVWDTGTDGHHGAILIVRDEDVVVALDGRVLWSSADTMVQTTPTRPSRPSRPSGSGGGLIAWLIGLFKPKPKPQAPLPHPEVPPEPAPEPPQTVPPAIVLPALRHRSIEDVRDVVLSGRHAHLLVPHEPDAFVDAVLAEVDDPRWGRHLRPNGRYGGGVIAFNVPDLVGGQPYRIYDIVAGAVSPSPAPGWLDQTATMEPASTFDPVAVDRVPPVLTRPRVRVHGTRFVLEGAGPFDWIGATSFDLPSRIRILGDLRWADYLHDEGFTLARIVPASRYRTPRALADGVRDLPRALAELAVRGLYAEVVIGVDTRDYLMSAADMRSYTRDVLAICREYSISLVELFNENTHGVQADFARDLAFLEELVGLCREAGVSCSAGSTHGGEPVRWTIGDYLTHHANRGRSPGANAVEMAHAQVIAGKPVVDDEPLGTAEGDQPGRRTADPAYAAEQGAACRLHHLGGATFHCEAGLTANVDLLGPIQREAARRFIAAMKGL